MTCGKCKKRPYCSKGCQVRDWKPDGDGQGHKDVCGRMCEEGVDYSVEEVPDSEAGCSNKKLVALQDIPAYTWIFDQKGRASSMVVQMSKNGFSLALC